jgi:hypothetical protein
LPVYGKEMLTAIALGIGLSASAGFRVFIPMLVASIAARAGIFPVLEGFQWLGSWPAIICFGTATVIEILAYYIPFIDNLLDSITTPMAIGAGTLLLTSVLPIDSGMLNGSRACLSGWTTSYHSERSVLARLASQTPAGWKPPWPPVSMPRHQYFCSLVVPVFIALLLLLVVFILVKIRKVCKHL